MNCPRCRAALEERERDGVIIDVCAHVPRGVARSRELAKLVAPGYLYMFGVVALATSLGAYFSPTAWSFECIGHEKYLPLRRPICTRC